MIAGESRNSIEGSFEGDDLTPLAPGFARDWGYSMIHYGFPDAGGGAIEALQYAS